MRNIDDVKSRLTAEINWVSTFPGCYHLKGGDHRLRISIQDYSAWGGICQLTKTHRGTFVGPVQTHTGTLSECKTLGEKWGERL